MDKTIRKYRKQRSTRPIEKILEEILTLKQHKDFQSFKIDQNSNFLLFNHKYSEN